MLSSSYDSLGDHGPRVSVLMLASPQILPMAQRLRPRSTMSRALMPRACVVLMSRLRAPWCPTGSRVQGER